MTDKPSTETGLSHLMALLSDPSGQEAILQETNSYTQRFGLTLSDTDIQMLLSRRTESLAEQRRIEFGNGILDKIIFVFCDSEFIYQGNYAETLAELQDIFYLYKNESLDELTDDELLETMREAFDGECRGSLDYLAETCLEQFARGIRASTHKFMGKYGESDDTF